MMFSYHQYHIIKINRTKTFENKILTNSKNFSLNEHKHYNTYYMLSPESEDIRINNTLKSFEYPTSFSSVKHDLVKKISGKESSKCYFYWRRKPPQMLGNSFQKSSEFRTSNSDSSWSYTKDWNKWKTTKPQAPMAYLQNFGNYRRLEKNSISFATEPSLAIALQNGESQI